MTQEQALTILKTGANVYLTGEPGSGKTHTVNTYVSYLRDHGIEPAITASTGIAATHIGGMTIHSWSGLGIKTDLDRYSLDKIASTEYVAKRIVRTNVLIIDEISMLNATMLTMVDQVCRAVRSNDEPFGGLQVVLVGDFFQLPPISKTNFNKTQSNSRQKLLDTEFSYDYDTGQRIEKNTQTNFAFSSGAWQNLKPVICYLTEQHRQDDAVYLEILSAIRKNEMGGDHIKELKKRKLGGEEISRNITKLYSHNLDVDRENSDMLNQINEKTIKFDMVSAGREALVAALKKGCLSPETLLLKVGSQVMCTKNNQKAGFVNGTLGSVIGFENGSSYPIIKTRDGREIRIEPVMWSVEENGKVRAEISQIPLRLAWAITVHKSQGMSLDEAVMDLGEVFEYGQGYVALSRVRRLSGLYLIDWNERAFLVHPLILNIDATFRKKSEEAHIAFSKLATKETETMHTNFIKACGGKLIAERTSKHFGIKSGPTREVTLQLWNEGKEVRVIAELRDLKIETILSHIEELVKEKKIPTSDLARLLTSAVIESLSHIQNTFRELDTDKLAPVFMKLDGKYSYQDLRIARILMLA